MSLTDDLKGSKEVMNTDNIVAKLLWYFNTCFFLHLQTNSHKEHKAFGKASHCLYHSNCKIAEYLLGTQAPKRFRGPFKLEPIPPYSDGIINKIGQSLYDYATEVYEWSETQDLYDLCKLIDEVQNIGAKLKYMGSFK